MKSHFWRSISLGIKRLFDLLVAASVLLFLSPLIALISLAIKLDDSGPILFVQDRVGKGRRRFRCYKFRTMAVGAESEEPGPMLTADDPNITRVGWFLRLWTLDELPQLLNVLEGDMSIVGPRPWVPSEAAYCGPMEGRRFEFRPGMAGWAWIHGRNLVPWEDRVQMDLWYVDNWSLQLDAYILAKAFVLLFRRRGVYGTGRIASDPDSEAEPNR